MADKNYADLREEQLLQLLMAKTSEMNSLMVNRGDKAKVRELRKEIEKIQKAFGIQKAKNLYLGEGGRPAGSR